MDLLFIERLCNEIKNTPLYQELKEYEQKMEEDPSLHPFFVMYQTSQSQYNDVLRLNLEGKKEKEAFKKSKFQLEQQETVKRYLEKHRTFNRYLDEIVHIVYQDIVEGTLINNPFQHLGK